MADEPLAATTNHTVKPGETLFGIAKQNDVSREAILAANPEISDPNTIRVGQIIRIPAAGTSAANPGAGTPASPVASTNSSAAGADAAAVRSSLRTVSATPDMAL